jgi:hypothetical protein
MDGRSAGWMNARMGARTRGRTEVVKDTSALSWMWQVPTDLLYSTAVLPVRVHGCQLKGIGVNKLHSCCHAVAALIYRVIEKVPKCKEDQR